MRDVSQKILGIRASAGNPNTVCCVCGKAPGMPYRRYDSKGAISEGCVDATHTGHLPPTTNTSNWHNRTDAVAIRRAEYDRLVRI